jgi:hypothetical protein
VHPCGCRCPYLLSRWSRAPVSRLRLPGRPGMPPGITMPGWTVLTGLTGGPFTVGLAPPRGPLPSLSNPLAASTAQSLSGVRGGLRLCAYLHRLALRPGSSAWMSLSIRKCASANGATHVPDRHPMSMLQRPSGHLPERSGRLVLHRQDRLRLGSQQHLYHFERDRACPYCSIVTGHQGNGHCGESPLNHS